MEAEERLNSLFKPGIDEDEIHRLAMLVYEDESVAKRLIRIYTNSNNLNRSFSGYRAMAQRIDLLSITKSRHRQLSTLPYYDPRYSHHFPYFTYGTIDMMLRDSRIRYALSLIKGPVYAYTKFFSQEEANDPAIQQAIIDLEYHYAYQIKADNPETEAFIIKTLNRFWNEGALKALEAVDWGYSPNQVVYKRAADGRIEYDKLIHYGVHHVKPVSRSHELTGIYLKKQNKFLPMPKSFVHVHQREHDNFTGKSISLVPMFLGMKHGTLAVRETYEETGSSKTPMTPALFTYHKKP